MATEDKRAYSRKLFMPDGGSDIHDGSLQRIADAMEKIIPGFDKLAAATATATTAVAKLSEQLAAYKADVARYRKANERANRTIQRLRKAGK